jgi:hypothetical protein
MPYNKPRLFVLPMPKPQSAPMAAYPPVPQLNFLPQRGNEVQPPLSPEEQARIRAAQMAYQQMLSVSMPPVNQPAPQAPPPPLFPAPANTAPPAQGGQYIAAALSAPNSSEQVSKQQTTGNDYLHGEYDPRPMATYKLGKWVDYQTGAEVDPNSQEYKFRGRGTDENGRPVLKPTKGTYAAKN